MGNSAGLSKELPTTQTGYLSPTKIHQKKYRPRLPRPDGDEYCWFWQADDDKWHPFSESESRAIDAQFKSDQNGKVHLARKNRTYEVDLGCNVQKSHETGKQRQVKRVAPLKVLPINSDLHNTHVWEWETDDGTWKEFDPAYGTISSAKIETALANKSTSVLFHAKGFSYVIDLKTSTQTNETSGKVRKIQRKRRAVSDMEIVYPVTWRDMTTESLLMVPLSSSGATAAEYRTVLDLFTKTMPGSTFKSLLRIQNKALYQRFYLSKKLLEERLGKNNGVQRLFHGTKNQFVDSICKQGFDSRLHTTFAYGKGSYFARDARYSNGFTDCNKMFVAQVLVGEFCAGNSAMVRPPTRTKECDLFDSVVNNVSDPSIFVVFEIPHSYPEYLIEYQ